MFLLKNLPPHPCYPLIRCPWLQDWDKASKPLKASGKEPKFVKPLEKFSATEGENVFVIFEIQGDSIPKVEWFKVCYEFRDKTRWSGLCI